MKFGKSENVGGFFHNHQNGAETLSPYVLTFSTRPSKPSSCPKIRESAVCKRIDVQSEYS